MRNKVNVSNITFTACKTFYKATVIATEYYWKNDSHGIQGQNESRNTDINIADI